MPRRIDPYARGQQVAAAVRSLVLEGGIEAVTIRAVAERSGLATSSLRAGYRDKAFLLQCVIWSCTDQIARAAVRRPRATGDVPVDLVELLATQLPADEEDLANDVLFEALRDRARWAGEDVRRARDDQLTFWYRITTDGVRALKVPPDGVELEATRLLALLLGLRSLLCDVTTPLTHDRAVEVLRRHVAGLVLEHGHVDPEVNDR